MFTGHTKVSKGAKIRNQYNQVPHLTQDTNGKVTNSQLDTTNDSQEVSPFPAGDHKACINRRVPRHSKHKTEKKYKKIHKRSTTLERSVKYFTGDTEATFLDLHLSISYDIVSTKFYDKRDDFDFEIFNFPFLDGDIPRSTSYGVYISQLIRFARLSSYVADFNTYNKLLSQKLLKQGYRYHKLHKNCK